MSYVTTQVIYRLTESNYQVLAAACLATPGKRRVEDVVEIDGFYANCSLSVKVWREPAYKGARSETVHVGNILPDGTFERNISERTTDEENYAIGSVLCQILAGF